MNLNPKKIIALLILFFTASNAAEVKIDSYGYVGAFFNQGFQGSDTSVIGLSARGGANFYFDNGLTLGLGAVGSWAAYDKNASFGGLGDKYTSSQYPNTGDVSDAFLRYSGNKWSLSFGRYDASFLGFDWLNGINTQGLAIKVFNLFKKDSIKKFDLWITYFNSILTTGYQKNRLGSELGTMYAYHPNGKSSFVGKDGNVVALGANMNFYNFELDPYFLFNNSFYGNNDLLLQGGVKLGYEFNFASNWSSATYLNTLLQFAPKYGSSDLGFLTWIDEELRYKNWVQFGLGFYFAGGQNIYAISDISRFYGKWVSAFKNSYFDKDLFSFYLFSSFNVLNDNLNIDFIGGIGNYSELSLVLKGTVWRYSSLKAEVGSGYVYSNFAKKSSGNLLVFTILKY